MRLHPQRVLRVVRFVLLLGVAVTAALWWRSCETIPPPDQSMAPTYPGGTTVLVDELSLDAPLERGTDVVYKWEIDGKDFARYGRVQALPGDMVGSKNGHLTVNGEPVGPAPIPGAAMGRVPEGKVLILAINPAETTYKDSRKLGFIPRKRVVGRIRAPVR